MSEATTSARTLLILCPACGGEEWPSTQIQDAEYAECILCVGRLKIPQALPADGRFFILTASPLWLRRVMRRQGASWFVSCFGSLSMNAAVLVLLMMLWIGVGPSDEALSLQVRFSASCPEESFQALRDPDPGAASSLSIVTVTQLPQSIAAGDSVADETSLVTGDGLGSGLGIRGMGAGGGGMFQGAPEARSFAYVVDASGSMAGPRMRLVLQEMVRSINALSKHQQFFVIFFSDRTFPMMWPSSQIELIDATVANRQRIVDWALNVHPDGDTKPQASLMTALKLAPDVLYFLTDGEIPRESMRIVDRLRKDNTVVNTICVGDARSGQLMKQIARKGNGIYTLVR